jgi:hypothetical protein
MQRRRRIAFTFSVLALIAAAASCREPTQMTLRITTGEKCTDLSGVQIVLGPSPSVSQDRFQQHYAAAVTRDCTPGAGDNLIGTLVVTPGGNGGTVVVAAGVALNGNPAPDPADCEKPSVAPSCIIARRSFSFIDHTSLTLPIDLSPLCVGKACDPASTCYKGSCVDANVGCADSSCDLGGAGTGTGADASSSDGAYDADLGDVMSIVDGSILSDSGNAGHDSGSVVTDATAGADTGTYDGPAPLCGNSGFPYCYPNGVMGAGTPGFCNGTQQAGVQCCHCTCAGTGAIGACNSIQSMGSSCNPMCP